MQLATPVDNQPISATFFGEGRWLTDFVTPDALEVKELYQSLIENGNDEITACWDWVANQVRYKRFIKGKIWIEGKTSVQDDLWNDPTTTIRLRVANCANKSFLLCSLLRNSLPPEKVHVVLGNLTSNGIGGHAWCVVQSNGNEYIIESTRGDISPVLASSAEIYEPVIIFNDREVKMIEGRVIREPFGYCCVNWLKDYLDMNRCDEFVGRD